MFSALLRSHSREAIHHVTMVSVRNGGVYGGVVTQTSTKSRAQSFSGSLSAVGRREKLWDDAISSNVACIFYIGCLQNSLSRTATNQKIEKILKEILLSRSLSRRPAAGKEPEKL